MKNGISCKVDPELLQLLKEIQKMRVEEGVDRYQKSLSEISYLAYKVLKQKTNLERLYSGKA